MPLTGGLSTLAIQWGVELDLTPLAAAEMAFNDMLAAALARDDCAYEAARKRFEAANRPDLRRVEG